ncbi:ERCC4-like helicase [Candidatus Methanoperedens nitroreducens]|uniref:ERCC4-like helicase n=1 Tax=Candidatus Methanoperedens nitratireducens TaxID=1392998 RepID=A0A062VC33_9EURY|nr:DEAD/DEAH box helicase [Candidatus Methanoperedens nitroreducens]KCZ73264.1 ERCC4-like helicase [Candidatus Methanoperedens nitroreducens]MDJ1422790.1 DEAD/DEAH box helicase [Candidatus Methanoperedens sp.]
MSDVEYINHPLVKSNTVEQRLYQLSLAGEALKKSTLIVLPTGLGKTVVALLVMVSRLPKGKVLILSPTRPLVEQHAAFFRNVLNISPESIVLFTGSTPSQKRVSMWEGARVVVSTPQVIENDLLGKRIDLRGVSCIIFDEAHRAAGNYSYVYIAEKYAQQNPDLLVLGITASPGSDHEKIQEVCANLHIKSVEMRTDSDPDVRPYIFDKDIEWRYVSIPVEIKGLKQLMDDVLSDRLNKLCELGFISPYQKKLSKMDMLDLQARMQSQLSSFPDQKIYKGISLLAEIFKISHAIEIAETQGVSALSRYFERLENEARSKNGSKAARRLMEDLSIRKAVHHLAGCDSNNPKLNAVKEIVGKQILEAPQSRIIIFTNYRDTAELVADSLKEVAGIRPIRFVGQASKYRDTGLTQKQQVEIIQKFKDGEYNTLVATSVAEEGLDIPATDLVLFFEPIPSEIRSIQRKGRTGRKHAGRVVILMAKGSKDEAYHWSSNRKEKSMLRTMKNLNDELEIQPKTKEEINRQQKKLPDFPEQEIHENIQEQKPDKVAPRVFIDQREIRSHVAQALEKLGLDIVLRTLEVGDYVVSDRVGIERKTVEDFLSTLMDGRDLFGQIGDLVRTFERPLLIIEGEGLYTARQVNPNSIRGVLTSIAIDFGVPIIFSRNEEDTAALISTIAKREQGDTKKEINLHGKRTALTLKEQQEYVISSMPEIGPVVAKNLLRHFGSIESVMRASREELMEVELVGPKTADRIKEVVSGEYKG